MATLTVPDNASGEVPALNAIWSISRMEKEATFYSLQFPCQYLLQRVGGLFTKLWEMRQKGAEIGNGSHLSPFSADQSSC